MESNDDPNDADENDLCFGDDEDEEGAGMDHEGDLSRYDDDDLFLDFEPRNDDLDSLFDKVNVVVNPSTGTEERGELMFLKYHRQQLSRWTTLLLIWIYLQGFLPEQMLSYYAICD